MVESQTQRTQNPTINTTNEDIIAQTLPVRCDHTTGIGPTLTKRVTRNASRSTDSSDIPSTSILAPPHAHSLSLEIQASLNSFVGSIMVSQQMMVDELRRINPNFQALTINVLLYFSMGPPTTTTTQSPQSVDHQMHDADNDDDDDANLGLPQKLF